MLGASVAECQEWDKAEARVQEQSREGTQKAATVLHLATLTLWSLHSSLRRRVPDLGIMAHAIMTSLRTHALCWLTSQPAT